MSKKLKLSFIDCCVHVCNLKTWVNLCIYLAVDQFQDFSTFCLECVLRYLFIFFFSPEYIHLADQYVPVPGGTNNNNYANVELILDIAKRTKVQVSTLVMGCNL